MEVTPAGQVQIVVPGVEKVTVVAHAEGAANRRSSAATATKTVLSRGATNIARSWRMDGCLVPDGSGKFMGLKLAERQTVKSSAGWICYNFGMPSDETVLEHRIYLNFKMALFTQRTCHQFRLIPIPQMGEKDTANG
jgi:hypothetical protein